MARGEITLAATGSGIPTQVLTDFIGEGGYSRSELGWSSVDRYSNNGVAAIAGPAYGTKYRWDLSFYYVESISLAVGAMLKWCEADKSRVLTLTDENSYLDPEPTPHSRTLVQALTPAGYTGSWQYGHGIFSVRPAVTDEHRSPAGSINGQWGELLVVSFQEV
ncbi:MAG: hypothetical protein ACFB0G_11245 [Leptolyngbyaceae cyanobacterium]